MEGNPLHPNDKMRRKSTSSEEVEIQDSETSQDLGFPLNSVPAVAVPPSEVRRNERSSSGQATDIRVDYIYHRLFAGSDAVSIIVALVLASIVTASSGHDLGNGTVALTTVLLIPVWLAIAYGAGLYHEVEHRIGLDFVDEFGTIAIASTAWSWLFVLFRSLLAEGGTDLLLPALMWIFLIPLLLIFRSSVRWFVRGRSWHERPIAVIGDPAGVSALTHRIGRHPDWGLKVKLEIGVNHENDFFIRREDGVSETKRGPVRFHAIDPERLISKRRSDRERDLAILLKELEIDRAIFVGGSQDLGSRTRLVHELIEREIVVDQITGGPETLYSGAVFQDLEGLPVLSVRPSSPRPKAKGGKRAADIVVSGFGLVLTSPILLWAAIRIKLDSEGPVFYRQSRCGLNDTAFDLIKLRTMHCGAHEMRQNLREETEDLDNDDVLFKIVDDPRVTRIGKTLRRNSIDELPQLWNVFKGDMSMVGPRPLVFEEARQATDLFAARTRMKPGIAGPWQALGRSSIPFEDMIKLDYAYVMSWSMSEDVRLLIRTITAVFSRKGAF